MSYDAISDKYSPKNNQILESELGKSQNWKRFRYLSNLKFLFVMKFVVKSS